MSRSRACVLLACLVPVLAVLVPAVSAQQPQPGVPKVACAFPAGGRQGTTVRVTLNGQYLGLTKDLVASGTGVTARVVDHTRPLSQKEVSDLREKLQELLKEKKTAEVQQQIEDIRKKLATFSRNANPALVETAVVELTIAPDAAPGPRELRLAAPLGLSNPVAFRVGTLEEVVEPQPEPAFENRFAQALPRATGKPAPPRARVEQTVTVPGVVNGRVMPGEVDRYRFAARKGQQLVAAVEARALTPYIADAVPGWFQATLAVSDVRGREIAYCDDFRFHPDPVLAFRVPEDGEYVLEIKDALYRGREDFVYRITLGETPFVTGVFPLGGRAGAPLTLQLEGWNLPKDRLEVDTTGLAAGTHSVAVTGPRGTSHRVPFALDTLPECLETEPNESPAAQKVTLPVIVNGRIDRPGDRDVFTFAGRAGDKVVAEVLARRLESPLDSTLRLTDAAGRTVAFNDDCEDPAAGLLTHHADSRLTATLPADGPYFVHVADAQNGGSSAHAYRLRLGAPRPDFELRVVPSTLSARSGQSVAFKVHAQRRDGFTGEIALALKDAPAGFALSGARIPAGQDAVRLTLAVPATAPDGTVGLALEGRVGEGDKAVVRPVLAADDMLQAFYIHHLVPARQLTVAVLGRGLARPVARVMDRSTLKVDRTLQVPAGGGSVPLRFETPRWAKGDQIRLELSEPPEGLSLQKVTADPGGVLTAQVYADAAKVKPGQQGNLIVNVFLNRPGAPTTAPAKPGALRRIPVGTLPALPYEVVAAPPKKPAAKP